MPKMSALQFAEQGHFSQVRAFAGDVLYTEGMPSPHLYVVKDGEVDLFVVRDEKRTVIETLRAGQCFGVDPHDLNRPRAHGAVARSYCELYVIDNATMGKSIEDCPDLVHSVLDTLSERLAVAHELIATRVNYQPELLIYAQLLHLAGLADLGRQAQAAQSAATASRGDAAAAPARPALNDVMNHARLMFGHSDRHIRTCLGKFIRLHLVRMEDDRGGSRRLVFSARDIVAQVRKVLNDDADKDKQTYQYLTLDEFAGLVEVDRAVLLKKLAGGEFADEVFTFRRAEIVRLLDEKGRRYFAERKLKPPADFSDLSDIEFADRRSIFDAVARMDSYDLAKVLHGLEAGQARDKLLGALSERRRQDVEQELQDVGDIDPVEARQIGSQLVNHVKAAMLQQAA